MRRTAIVGFLALALAGCSQTSSGSAIATPAGAKSPARAAQKTPAPKQGSCEQAMQAQTNAAMLGSVLGMAGGLGGFAGNGGAIAGQVAATGGSLIANSQANSARAAMMRDCYQ
ncbi:hypothetical protein [Aquamicrobium soli]|uniref:Glycine zipper family protein n=1 Tax=Aquamicrobium soli TaxID=1811518 RepID=A0ABV7KJ98_9HYPH